MARPANIVVASLAVVLLLGGAYMGGYYAMLSTPWENVRYDGKGGRVRYLEPTYRKQTRLIHTLFWPAHRFDCWIRPSYWYVEPWLPTPPID